MINMQRVPYMRDVGQSDSVNAIGYEDGDLYVEYSRNSSLYVYHGVSRYVFEEAINASSPGSYLARHVKKSYPYERIG